jgi:hypothetical protein
VITHPPEESNTVVEPELPLRQIQAPAPVPQDVPEPEWRPEEENKGSMRNALTML